MDLPGVCLRLFQTEISVSQQINLVNEQQRRLPKHKRVFKRLFITFGHAEDHDLEILPHLEFGRAHEVTYVFDNEYIDIRQIDVGQRGGNHVGVKMTGAACVQLHHGKTILLQSLFVSRGLNVAHNHPKA